MPTKKPQVHIVCYDDGHIIPRMYRWLSQVLGWSMGPFVATESDVINYYAPYTMLGHYGASQGKSMAWFTHKETASPAKIAIWERGKQAIDYPLVTSPLYQHELGARLITPGIDQDHFKPRGKQPGKGVIGVVGTYQPRKGPELALTLNGIKAAKTVRVVGDDWPSFTNSQKIPYADMPAFYCGLDLFVCTSTEEGIPAPPLEALACGIPVVIPRNVGMLDLLPDEAGIYRYEAGNEKEMATAVRAALAAKHDRNTLRDFVAPYTVGAWVESHQRVLEQISTHVEN